LFRIFRHNAPEKVTEFMLIRAGTIKDESNSAVSKKLVIASRASEEVTRLLRSSGKSDKSERSEEEKIVIASRALRGVAIHD
jgi:hypothetical protein